MGYINLFPFFTGMLRDELADPNERKQVENAREKVFDILSDEEGLLSEDGIRSLSIKDPLYGSGDNYWQGAVWMPINYLVLRACKEYY